MKKGVVLGVIALVAALGIIFYLKQAPVLQSEQAPAATEEATPAPESAMMALEPEEGTPPAEDATAMADEAGDQPQAVDTDGDGENDLAVSVEKNTEAEGEDLTEDMATEEAAPAPEAEEEAAAEEPAQEAATEDAATEETAAAPAAAVDVSAAMADRVIGDENAPVTIIEYASLTCPHCAQFATGILADVKARLIDTGKAKLIYRDYPIDRVAMTAAKLARCASEDQYFDLVEVLFKNQERWVASEDREAALMQYGALAGMSDDYMRACIGSSELEAAILASQTEAQSRFGVRSTPTFVINYGAEIIVGAQPVEKFEEAVNKLTAGQPEQ